MDLLGGFHLVVLIESTSEMRLGKGSKDTHISQNKRGGK